MPVMPSPTGPGIPETMSKVEIARLFHEVAGPDGEIDWQELKRLMDQIMKDGKRLFLLTIKEFCTHSESLIARRLSQAHVCESRGEPTGWQRTGR